MSTEPIEPTEWQCELCGEWIERGETCIPARTENDPPDWPTKHCHIDCLDEFYFHHGS